MSPTPETPPAAGRVRRLARRVLGPVRRFNRWWIDRLDPDARGSWAPVEEVPSATVRPATPAAPATAGPALTIRREDTPNPDAMKFVCSRRVVPSGSLSFSNARAGEAHPLGRAIFGVPGVRSLFAINDFVTVTRGSDGDWEAMGPAIEAALRAFFATA